MKKKSHISWLHLCCLWIVSAAAGTLLSGPARAQTPTQPVSPAQDKVPGNSTTSVSPSPSSATTALPTGQPNSAAPPISGQASGGLGGKASRSLPPLVPGQAITLEQALTYAQANQPAFVTAAAAARVAKLDRSIAQAALLPSAVYHNQYLFTESSKLPPGDAGTTGAPPQIFIANNAVHEYASQGSVTEKIGLTEFNALARTAATVAITTAELEISRRGLVSTVVGLFYAMSTAQEKIGIEQRALTEATDFVKQTQEREAQREAAHADVVKAQLTLQQRQRDLADAQVAFEKAQLDLGVLLFPDPRTPYTVALPPVADLPTREATEAAATRFNPELTSALATTRAAQLGVTAARAAFLPELVLNYSYGIDAERFAAGNPDGSRNLGYSASATLDIPVWDWLATAHKVKQASILRDAAQVNLTNTQRRFVANLQAFYNELRVAHDQLDSLRLSADTARESLRLTRLRYSNAEATVLEVVDAQNSLTAAEVALQDGTVRYQLALANLQTLTGNY